MCQGNSPLSLMEKSSRPAFKPQNLVQYQIYHFFLDESIISSHGKNLYNLLTAKHLCSFKLLHTFYKKVTYKKAVNNGSKKPRKFITRFLKPMTVISFTYNKNVQFCFSHSYVLLNLYRFSILIYVLQSYVCVVPVCL